MNAPLKVMVVEDSLTAQKLIVSILSKDPNIDVIGVASSGEEAIKLLENLEPDVITMDIHMPGMNGLDVTRKNHGNQTGTNSGGFRKLPCT
jgi:Chemotaxis response regulator containing a CheY-like receiver domain and a methylesterase domain